MLSLSRPLESIQHLSSGGKPMIAWSCLTRGVCSVLVKSHFLSIYGKMTLFQGLLYKLPWRKYMLCSAAHCLLLSQYPGSRMQASFSLWNCTTRLKVASLGWYLQIRLSGRLPQRQSRRILIGGLQFERVHTLCLTYMVWQASTYPILRLTY